jgi:hypothetical protein
MTLAHDLSRILCSHFSRLSLRTHQHKIENDHTAVIGYIAVIFFDFINSFLMIKYFPSKLH